MVKILPSLLNSDFFEIKETIARLEECGITEVHIDVMDGVFVEDIAFGPKFVRDLRPHTSMTLDVHLMIDQPEHKIQAFIESGADILTIHIESSHYVYKVLQMIQAAGLKAGIAINPHTPINQLEYLLDMVDQVTVLTINPGTDNAEIIESMYGKIEQLAQLRKAKNYSYDILVDGKVDGHTVQPMVQKGVDKVVSGGTIFKDNQIEENIQALRQAIEEVREYNECHSIDSRGN